MKKFFVRFNGDDARVAFETDDYNEACRQAAARSVSMDWGGHLGFAVFNGETGNKIAVYKDGEIAAFRSRDGEWVEL